MNLEYSFGEFKTYGTFERGRAFAESRHICQILIRCERKVQMYAYMLYDF